MHLKRNSKHQVNSDLQKSLNLDGFKGVSNISQFYNKSRIPNCQFLYSENYYKFQRKMNIYL